MFSRMSMRARLIAMAVVGAGAAGAALPVIAGAASAPGPTGAQIRAAVRRAEKSRDLWATLNVCNVPVAKSSGYKQIGVRVQMPALGFTTHLYMTLGIQAWDAAHKRYVTLNSRYGPKSIGLAFNAPSQDGYSFYYRKPVAEKTTLVRGIATLEWRIGKRVLGRVTRPTGGGYEHVDFGNPHGLSVATCTVTA